MSRWIEMRCDGNRNGTRCHYGFRTRTEDFNEARQEATDEDGATSTPSSHGHSPTSTYVQLPGTTKSSALPGGR